MVDFNAEMARIDADTASAQTRLGEANQAYQTALKTGGERETAANDAVRTAMAQPLPQAPESTLPKPPEMPKVNPKEFEGLGMGILALAMLGGAKGNWLAASSALNGTMEGIIQGNKDEADRRVGEYQRAFGAAKAADDEALRKYEKILSNRSLSINEMIQQAKLVATENQHAEVQAQANVKSVQGMLDAIEKRRMSLLSIDQRNEAVLARIQASKENAATRAAHGAANGLSDAGAELYNEIWRTTGQQPHTFGGQAQAINKAAEDAVRTGRSFSDVARDIASGKLTMGGAASGARQATVRLQAVDRLTQSVQSLEGRLNRLVQQAGPGNVPTMNAMTNWVKRNAGDGQLQELQTLMQSVSRQYVEAVTMPGSNAQMHAGAQQLADSLLNPNQSPAQIAGTLRAMNAEIGATHKALEQQVQQATQLPARDSGATGPSGKPVPLDEYLKSQGF